MDFKFNNKIMVESNYNYLKDILEKPYNHSYEELMGISLLSDDYMFLQDYMLLNCALDKKEEEFRNILIKYEYYDIFLYDTVYKKDDFLKTHVVLYLENDLFYSIFKDDFDLAKTIVKNNKFKEQYKLYDLLTLSEFQCSKKTINYIKKSIKQLLDNCNKLDPSFKVEDYINHYMDIIDENQAYFDEKTYKYNNIGE